MSLNFKAFPPVRWAHFLIVSSIVLIIIVVLNVTVRGTLINFFIEAGLAFLVVLDYLNVTKNIKQLTYQNKLLNALRSLDKTVLSTLEVEPLCQAIIDLVNKELGYTFGVIALMDQQASGIRRVAISQNQDPKLEKVLKELPVPFKKQVVPLQTTDNLLVRAVQEKRSFYTSSLFDIQKGVFSKEIADKIQSDLGIKLIFVYPLVTKDQALGIIYFATTRKKEEIAQIEYSLMEEFTQEVSRALDNAMLYQSLKTEKNKMSVVLSGITDAVVAVDLNRNIVIFNNAAENLLDYSASEVLGKPIDQVIRLFDKDLELFPINYCPVNYSGPDGIAFNKKEIKIIGRGNKESYVNLISGRIKDDASANLGCILTMHDVTKEKQLEEMRLDFVSMAAHELRTPLTSVRGYIDVVRKEAPLSEEYRLFLERAMIAAAQLVDLVENLLSVSKIERGVFTVNTTPLDWTSYVKQTVGEFSERAKERNLQLMFIEPKEPIPTIKADKLRIKEVLTNLIANAINYTKPDGKINVSIETNPEKTAVITHIQDTGQGIPPEAISHLFTKFFRVSGALEQGSKGTGLGLYISKSIVDMHHGKIWVNSEVGKGSTFSFLLPV